MAGNRKEEGEEEVIVTADRGEHRGSARQWMP